MLSVKILGEVNEKDTQFSALIKKNQEMVLLGSFIAILGIGFLIYSFASTGGRQGTWRYGLCKVFIELYEQYPTDIKILTVAEKQVSAQAIHMAQRNPSWPNVFISRIMPVFVWIK